MEFTTVEPILSKMEQTKAFTKDELGQVERCLIMMELYGKVIEEMSGVKNNGFNIKYRA